MRPSDANRRKSAAHGIGHLLVRARPGHPTQGLLTLGGRSYVCAIGRGGIRSVKREGDGGTPLGVMRPLAFYWRSDKWRRVPALLPGRPLADDDGWCDAPRDANYNRPVRLPFSASHERMIRHDRLYDCVVVLDWNMRPRMRGRGSAIFLHIAKEGFAPTEGCIAVEPASMRRILPLLSRRTTIRVLR